MNGCGGNQQQYQNNGQYNPNNLAQSQNMQGGFPNTSQGYNPAQDPLVMSKSGSILNSTRGMTMEARDYPIILDGEVIIADGTVKPGYSKHFVTQFHTKDQQLVTQVTAEE